MTDNPFAALLDGVPRFEIVAHEWDTYDCQDGDYVRYSEVLAALAAAAVPDDLAEAKEHVRLLRLSPWSDGYPRLDELPDLITALLARIAAQEAQIKGLEAEAVAMRDAFLSIEHLTDSDRIRGIARAARTAAITEAGQ